MIWKDFFPFVLPSVPSCPDDTVIHHIRLAAIEFCKSTLVWCEELDHIEADGTTDYTLNLNAETELVKLISVNIGEQNYACVTPRYGRALIRESAGDSIAFTPNQQELVVYPAPGLGGDIVIEAALKPAITASEFSDDLFAHHAKAIADGALADLYSQPKKDWTDMQAAAFKRNLFEAAISTAGMAASKGNSTARLRVRAHFF